MTFFKEKYRTEIMSLTSAREFDGVVQVISMFKATDFSYPASLFGQSTEHSCLKRKKFLH